MADKRMLTLTELSKYLCIPRRTFYRMVIDGRFAVKPVAGTKPRRWRIEDVNAWRDTH